MGDRRSSTLPLAVFEFHRWLNNQWETGVIGPESERNSSDLDADRHFLPSSKLKEYLGSTTTNLRNLLKAVCPREVEQDLIDVAHIQKYYLHIFAILVFIGKGEDISYFTEHFDLADERLPFDVNAPAAFPWRNSPEKSYYSEFFQAQWKFWVYPMRWARRTELQSESILPIISKIQIGAGTAATTYRIKLHPEYNQLREYDDSHLGRDDPQYDTFVLKTYAQTEQAHYDNEVDAFLRVRHSHYGPTRTPGFIGFYGSFKQDGVFNIILEWANHGTLEEYFQKEVPPKTFLERYQLWKSMLGLLLALKSIHEVRKRDPDDSQLVGWHQDVKPDNILICKKEGKSIYEYDFKLADLGLSHFKTKKNENSLEFAQHGNRTYGAPECYRHDDFSARQKITVTPVVDVWSLGCILSEAVTWVMYGLHGQHGLDKYRQNRVDATRGIPNHQSVGCFHDGNEALMIVKVQHSLLLTDIEAEDKITKEVLHLSDRMLWHEKNRETAAYLYNRSEKVLGMPLPVVNLPQRETKDKPSTSVELNTEKPNRAQPTNQEVSNKVPPTSGKLKPEPWPVAKARESRKGKKSTSKYSHELSDSYRNELNKRDFTIIVDDSSTMREHWDKVIEMVDLLGFVLKDFDTDGIDMIFTNSDGKRHNSKFLDELVTLTRNNRPPPDGPNRRMTNINLTLTPIVMKYTSKMNSQMAKKKGSALDRMISKAAQKIYPVKASIIYMLTDGLWQPGDQLGPHIKKLLETLDATGTEENQFGIQFIQFGDSKEGSDRLVALDRTRSGAPWNDVVDTEPADGDFGKMLLGPINRWYDNDPGTQQSVAGPST